MDSFQPHGPEDGDFKESINGSIPLIPSDVVVAGARTKDDAEPETLGSAFSALRAEMESQSLSIQALQRDVSDLRGKMNISLDLHKGVCSLIKSCFSIH